jgi:hypothetical protein
MMIWTFVVSACEEAIQYRKGTGTETTHWRVVTQGMTRSTGWEEFLQQQRDYQP